VPHDADEAAGGHKAWRGQLGLACAWIPGLRHAPAHGPAGPAARPCTCPRRGAQQMDEAEGPRRGVHSIATLPRHPYAGLTHRHHVDHPERAF
jgi:hypothetical protein